MILSFFYTTLLLALCASAHVDGPSRLDSRAAVTKTGPQASLPAARALRQKTLLKSTKVSDVDLLHLGAVAKRHEDAEERKVQQGGLGHYTVRDHWKRGHGHLHKAREHSSLHGRNDDLIELYIREQGQVGEGQEQFKADSVASQHPSVGTGEPPKDIFLEHSDGKDITIDQTGNADIDKAQETGKEPAEQPDNIAATTYGINSGTQAQMQAQSAGVPYIPRLPELPKFPIQPIIQIQKYLDLLKALLGQRLSGEDDREFWDELVGYDVDAVLQVGEKIASHSWEFGIMSEALLEYYSPSLSVFSKTAYANGKVPTPTVTRTPALAYALNKINLTHGETLVDGAGASGDPASLMPPAVLIGQSDPDYIAAATRQIGHLYKVPKYWNGAISQRDDIAELWADAVYMIHPSLAAWSVQKQDTTYVLEAARQAGLYRQILQANTTASWKGLWTHIVGPQSQTLGIWLTGNGWAAMGMSRVLATLVHWPTTASSSATQQANLKQWIYEILSGAKNTQLASNGLLKNYLVGGPKGQDDPASADFGDATGTAMIAAVAYRMAVLDPTKGRAYVNWANGLLQAVAKVVTKAGLVTNTVNPLNWYDTQAFNKGSPEGQASVAILAAAFRDCVYAGVCASL